MGWVGSVRACTGREGGGAVFPLVCGGGGGCAGGGVPPGAVPALSWCRGEVSLGGKHIIIITGGPEIHEEGGSVRT